MSEENAAESTQEHALEAQIAKLTRQLEAMTTRNAELEARWDYTKNVAEALPFIIYIYDRETQVTSWVNRHIGENLGYTKEEIQAMGSDYMVQLLHPDDLKQLPQLLKRWETVKDGDMLSTTYRMKDAEGNWHWYLGQDMVFSRNEAGEVHRFVGTTFNIDNQKAAEEERLKFERKMLHAQKLESLGVLAGGIAHDFNNLLVSIMGYADLALTESVESVRKEYLEEIKLGAHRSSELANLMLAYSGKGAIQKKALSMNDLIYEITELVRTAISKKATITHELGHNVPAVEGDATQLRQVVMNLITNASDAIGDQDGIITIRTHSMHYSSAELRELGSHQQVEAGTKLVIEVIDTGCGMSEDDQKRLFDPFFTTKVKGRGLGMSAVLGIVRSHDGIIHVSSTPGQGSTFQIILPASAEEAVQEQSEERPSDGAERWTRDTTILVVDDEDSV